MPRKIDPQVHTDTRTANSVRRGHQRPQAVSRTEHPRSLRVAALPAWMGALTLSHFSRGTVITPRTVDQTEALRERLDKPDGLWVSVDGEDDWPAWCKAEGYDNIDAKNRFRVHLAPDANLLILDTDEQILRFTQRYQIGELGGIDWPNVAEGYQGVIIAPYSWNCRSDVRTTWYYGWDCASGCIWDAEAIAQIEFVS